LKPAPFAYGSPETVEEAIALLQRYDGEARVLAGGQSLVPMMNMRLARPAALIDLSRIAGIDVIAESDGHITVGAMTRQRAVERSELVARRQPLLRTATQQIGHPQIRNRGTVGGSLAHAHPASEYQAVAVALGASFTLRGPGGARVVPAEDFFVTYLTTALAPDEILTEVSWPVLPPRTGWSLVELARRHGDFAVAGVAATVTDDSAGRCVAAQVSLFGIGPVAVRAREAEGVLTDAAADAQTFARAAQAAADAIAQPPSDVHASGDYRRHAVAVLTRRALQEAAERARMAA
jgi:carbon-monoxide dehydrogenase medium subunit